MLRLLLSLVIVAGAEQPPNAARTPGAIEVFRCDFGESVDRDFDLWPDSWTRAHGPGYPHYVGIKMRPGAGPSGGGCLQIDLDGGGAVALSPPLPIDPHCRYLLEVSCKTEGLVHDRVFLSLEFLDEQKRLLESFESAKRADLSHWTTLRLGPVSPRQERARFVTIGLHLEPLARGGFEDLRGRAAFSDVWLGRLPRIELATGRALNFFRADEPVEVVAHLSGLAADARQVDFQLDDAFGGLLARVERPLVMPPSPKPAPKGKPADKQVTEKREAAAPPAQQIAWKLPLPGPGFYQVRAGIQGSAAASEDSLTLAVIEPLGSAAGSPFGWTLPPEDRPLPLDALPPLFAEAGVGWVKFPVWVMPDDPSKRLDALAAFAEQLEAQGVRRVAVLADPPEEIRKQISAAERVTAADVFTASPATWQPHVEPILARLAGKLRWWQLGDDRDMSFVGYPGLPAKLRQTRAALARLGGEIVMGIPWSWLEQPPPEVDARTCQFLALRTDPGFTPQELSDNLAALAGAPFRRVVDLEPLPRGRYPLEVRAADLVERMVGVKIQGAEAAFVSDPFDAQRGLLAADGSPTELFLPWRTTALLLAGAQDLGSFEFVAGGRNRVFARSHDAVMVAWSERRCQAVVYLGPQIRQLDMWGRPGAIAARERGQVLDLGPLPVFITGLHLPIARWSLDLKLAQTRIPSICDRPHANALRLKSSFDQALTGRALLVGPDGWTIAPNRIEIRLGPNESFEQPIQITLSPDATSGRQTLRVDFELQADRLYTFSVQRAVEVGLDDVVLEVHTRMDPHGELEVEQRLINNSDRPVSFRCQLFAPGRQLQKADVFDLAPGRAVRTYRFAEGESLLGRKLWLRAEEIGGPRTLNSRFTAER